MDPSWPLRPTTDWSIDRTVPLLGVVELGVVVDVAGLLGDHRFRDLVEPGRLLRQALVGE